MIRRIALVLTALAAVLVAPVPAQAAAHGDPVVRTDAGRVRGESTAEGRQFLGIPYAEPPVGRLRWRAPHAVRAWHGVRSARDFGNKCVQSASWDPGYEQPSYTESCLDLNVYVPDGFARRSVLVWFHGGGLTAGAGQDVVPDTFARQTGTVVVTVNYRLGAMGFLATAGLDGETHDRVSGNFGMLDQQAALRWVRANISRFGGDPARVTIAGESAGGRSVCTQLASPTARGLFRAGIIESGAYDDCGARTHQDAVAQGADFVKKLGCTDIACLRGKSAREILEAQGGFDWGPVAGGAFLPVQPEEAVANGTASRVPVINGSNKDEGRLFAFAAYDLNGTPLTAGQYPDVMRNAFGEQALQRYPLSAYPTPTIAYATALGDTLFSCPALRLDGLLATRGRVYSYEFADLTSPPFASLRNLHTDFDFGATHVNEVQYLFRQFGLDSPLNAEQRVLSRQMVQYWGSFVRDGVPRAEGQPVMPGVPGTVLSLKTASKGGNTLSTSVHQEHQCDLWDGASTG
ncbi:carboxylesterase family protein [Streptomyces sp. NBC_00461]|uniref:carboxylesterase/lipase family protein n=1 Tax=unclassified Streptomyces TaxID=2593676 RepID=UPI002255B881|nr:MULTISPECIES: carboxylesterase family protein [unclassified Streptomyces]MCX5058712.1 carboxylesterase family protein [Streptomyces sp. NBC_00452]